MIHKLSTKEKLIQIAVLLLLIMFLAKMFYGTFFAGVVLIPMIIPLYKQRKKQLLEKKKQKMECMFKDMLVSLSDALKTGYSVENALKESYQDIRKIYGNRSPICVEMRLMISRIKLNVPMEEVLKEFALRTEMKAAGQFYQVFSVAKRTGGNMTEVIKSVTDSLVLKEAVKEEITVEIHGKRMEHRIMMGIPVFMVLYVSTTSAGFLDVMYETMLGRIVMTFCIVGYIIAYLWGEKIVQVEV
jgi:tight adherence protein B